MQINNYPKYIFWNYADDADLPENIVAEQVLSYGDIEDISLAFKQISKEILINIVNKMKLNERWKKRVNFIEKVFIGNLIKNNS